MVELIMSNLPIVICFVIGVGLLVLEAFLPGFGVAGTSGLVLEVITLVMTWHKHGPVATLAMLLIVLLVLAIAISMSLRSITSGRLSNSQLVHSESEQTEGGYRSTQELDAFMDKVGVTSSVLRPAGIADFDGVRLNVSSEGDFIPAGTQVRIVRIEGAKVLVKPV